jgi:hypothetical protein
MKNTLAENMRRFATKNLNENNHLNTRDNYKSIPSEIRSELNRMIHKYIETNPNEDYSDYKGLIGAIYDFAINFQQKITPNEELPEGISHE